MQTSKIFLVDEMLKGLGRWLRVAGYDTLILEDGQMDAVLLQRAVQDGRLLLTRDRAFLQHRKAADTVVLLECNGLDDCAAALSRQLQIDWLYSPFSRCMNCNTPLVKATRQQTRSLHVDTTDNADVLYCPACDQLYWHGSHVDAMLQRLQHWSAGFFTPDLCP